MGLPYTLYLVPEQQDLVVLEQQDLVVLEQQDLVVLEQQDLVVLEQQDLIALEQQDLVGAIGFLFFLLFCWFDETLSESFIEPLKR